MKSRHLSCFPECENCADKRTRARTIALEVVGVYCTIFTICAIVFGFWASR